MRRLSMALFGFISLSTFTGTALAGESAYRAAVTERSARVGLGSASVAELRRGTAPGRDAVVNALLSEFAGDTAGIHTGTALVMRPLAKRTLVTGDDWFLEARANGDWIRYRDVEYVDGPDNVPVSVDARPTLGTLAAQGLSFVQSRLASVVQLAAGESLEAWYASYSINISGHASEEPVREVIASKVVFTRVVDGLPVLGNGSKVVVYIAADGTVYGFDVDWSPFVRQGRNQSTIDLAAVYERAEVVRAAQGTGAAAEPPNRLECGYYDAGARMGTAGDQIQAACVSMFKLRPDDSVGSPSMDVIPAGVHVEEDASWPETSLFARH